MSIYFKILFNNWLLFDIESSTVQQKVEHALNKSSGNVKNVENVNSRKTQSCLYDQQCCILSCTQGVSQDLEIQCRVSKFDQNFKTGCPKLFTYMYNTFTCKWQMKQGVQIVHLQYFYM